MLCGAVTWLDIQEICEARIAELKKLLITMLPKIIRSIDMKGATVTIDAIGCQTEIVKSIQRKKANHMIELKRNQPNAYHELAELFEYMSENSLQAGVDV